MSTRIPKSKSARRVTSNKINALAIAIRLGVDALVELSAEYLSEEDPFVLEQLARQVDTNLKYIKRFTGPEYWPEAKKG